MASASSAWSMNPLLEAELAAVTEERVAAVALFWGVLGKAGRHSSFIAID
jgi:hypothetical protein